jgi:ABC-type branched-subunit amino acid transport system ATPase component
MTLPLAVDRLSAGYGAADVIKNVSISLGDGECVAVLGANGAGKTSLLRDMMSCRSGRAACGLTCWE